MLLSALVFVSAVPAVAAEFFSPNPNTRAVWEVHSVQEVRYKTNAVAYTIALWQQSLTQGSASKGPILFETTNGPDTKFDWLVQTYDMDLTISNVFFLWLFEGPASNQDNQSVAIKLVSPYFNITTASKPASSPTTFTPTALVSTTSRPPASTQDAASSSSPSLSIGVKAGIGASAGIAGLSVIVAAALLFSRYRSRREEEREESTYIYSPDGKRAWKEVKLPPPRRFPAKMSKRQKRTAAELECNSG